jgi:FkbM family methyltransferase
MSIAESVRSPFRHLRQLGRQLADSPFTRHAKLRGWARFVRWQTVDRALGRQRDAAFVNDLVIEVCHGRAAATGVLYLGLPEVESMSFFAHALRSGDTMLDIGANIGTYSVLAAGVAGCRVLAMEPVPDTYALLVSNLRRNSLLSLAEPMNVAASDRAGTVRMTHGEDSTNHVLGAAEAGGIEVRTARLDELVAINGPTFMKLDVEGHEQHVLAGASRLLADPRLEAIAMEFEGCGAHFGVDEAALYRSVLDHGFESCAYDPESRRLTPCTGGPGRHGNTIFVRDRAAMQRRLETAAPIRVFGTSL